MSIRNLLSAGLLSVAALSQAATDIGERNYEAYANGPNLPAQTITLPAYEGANTVFYYDRSQVSLNRSEINSLVRHLDTTMALYRDYGKLSSYPHPNFGGLTEHPDKGSVVLREGPDEGFAAGLGLNGKAEVFKFGFNSNAFDLEPTDVRTWEIAYYELGRGTDFAIYDFFKYATQSQGINSAFPRFITFSVIEDLGINHTQSAYDEFWRSFIGTNPVLMNNKLQPLLAKKEYFDFYKAVEDPENPGSTIIPGKIEYDFNGDGDTDDRNESIGLNDAQATIFYFLRKRYGHAFMLEFFNYAAKHASSMKPNDPLSAICNIVQAGNEALLSTSKVATSQNRVGNYLKNTFKFPDCVLPLPDRQSFEYNFGRWQNTGEFDWLRKSGSTLSRSTGPNAAGHRTHYVYMETSRKYAYDKGDVALLESPAFAPGNSTLSFEYHMYGSNIGTLAVDIYRGNRWRQVWSVSSQQHWSGSAPWTKKIIPLYNYANEIKVRFRAVAAGGYRGDIAIDNIKISDRPEIRYSFFDGDWFYFEWQPVNGASEYTQFVIGNATNSEKWLMEVNAGASDRGNYRYSYYHRNQLCNAFGKGTFKLRGQIWPDRDSSKAVNTEVVNNTSSITCR